MISLILSKIKEFALGKLKSCFANSHSQNFIIQYLQGRVSFGILNTKCCFAMPVKK